MGSYSDEVICDVMPMSACHILLGRPWQFDRDVKHHGRINEYELEHNGKVIMLKPMSSHEVHVMNSKNKPICTLLMKELRNEPNTIWVDPPSTLVTEFGGDLPDLVKGDIGLGDTYSVVNTENGFVGTKLWFLGKIFRGKVLYVFTGLCTKASDICEPDVTLGLTESWTDLGVVYEPGIVSGGLLVLVELDREVSVGFGQQSILTYVWPFAEFSAIDATVIENEAVRTSVVNKTRWGTTILFRLLFSGVKVGKTDHPSMILFVFCIWVVNGSGSMNGYTKELGYRQNYKTVTYLDGVDDWVAIMWISDGGLVIILDGVSGWIVVKIENDRRMERGASFLNKLYVFLLNRYNSSELRSFPPKEGGNDADMERALFVICNKEVLDSELFTKEAECDCKKTWQVTTPYRVTSLSEWRVGFRNGPGLYYAWELGSNEVSHTLELLQQNCDAAQMVATQRGDGQADFRVSDLTLRRSLGGLRRNNEQISI